MNRFRLLSGGRGANGTTELPRNPFERAQMLLVIGRLAAAAMAPGRRFRNDGELATWLLEHQPFVGASMPFDGDPHEGSVRLDRLRVRRFGLALAERAGKSRAAPSGLARRLEWVGETLSLDPVERQILALAVRVATCEPFGEVIRLAAQTHSGSDEVHAPAMGSMLGVPERAVRARLRPGSTLAGLGLLEDRGSGDVAPSGVILRLVAEDTVRPERLSETLLGPAPSTELRWQDFVHLGRDRDLAVDLVRKALERGTGERDRSERDGSERDRSEGATAGRSVNVLLYGEPGTGKTEFAKVLGRCVRARAVFVGEEDDGGGEPSRSERMAHLALASRLAAAAVGRTVLVVDEADDVFAGVDGGDRMTRVGSKVFMNRVVEHAPVPTIWITNHPDRLGPAVMRRMSLAVRFGSPQGAGRRRMLKRMSGREGVALRVDEIDRLARMDAAPALLEAGLRVAALTGTGADGAERAAFSLVRAMGGAGPRPQPPRAFPFDVALANADTDLERLVDRVAAAPSRALSFLLAGPPGTGKSLYARHLAERLGLETMERRASDILSMWVGGTERAVAAAFAEARDTGRMLIVDEADSLLRAREGAERSWEVTQVNEMLTWMECHPLPFAMTTNAVHALDPAAMRRFVFAVTFAPMRRAQIGRAFRAAFGASAPAAALAIPNVTPGDVAVVARRAAVLGETDPDALARLLERVCAAKPDAARGPLGFAPRMVLKEPG